MKLRILAVLACVAIGGALGGIAVLLDAPSHAHDDSDEAVRDTLMRAVDDNRRIGRRIVVNLSAIREAGL